MPLLPFAADAALRVHLVPIDPGFPLWTDLAELAALAAPLYTHGAPGQPLTLLDQDPPPGRPRDALAAVEVRPGAAVPEQTPELEVTFQARSARWAYYCVTDLEAADDDPLEIFADGPVSFGAENRRELTEQPDPEDRIAAQLAARYGDRRRIRFLSDQPVDCRQHPQATVELRRKGQRVAGPLATPPVANHSTVRPTDQEPEESLFQIVKYLANPFSQLGD